MSAKSIIRVRVILGAILLVAFLIVFRLYDVQIVNGSEYRDRADRQYIRTVGNLFDRGSIFLTDKTGQLVSAATLKTGYTVALDPRNIDHPEDVFNLLSSYLPLEENEFMAHATKKDDPYEEIATRIEPDTALKIENAHIPGVGIYQDRWRYYPGDTLAARTVGFVAYDQDVLKGVYGLERYYDDVLTRTDSSIRVNFFAEIFSNINKTLFDRSSQGQGDIVTSIEPSVQLYLEEQLKAVQDKFSSKMTAGIVMDPNTGEIFALGVNPTFDLNTFSEEKNPSIYGNPLVEDVYEMGSIVKALTMAAGLDSGAVTPETTYDDKGFIEVDGAKISNYDGVGRGVVPMQQVLNQSLNTGAAFVESKIGNEKFADYMRAYGIGEETGIDLPNESAGLIDNLYSPRDVEYRTASFGQGIAMTPISTIRALATLANGGHLVTPHLATEIKYKTGIGKRVSFHDDKQAISKATSEAITKMLVRVVDEALANGTVALRHYSIAAKTGTAQIAKPNARGYYDDRYLHSFFGYFPAYKPRFLVFLMTVEPHGEKYASQTLTAPFMDIAKFLINYYDVPPDR